MQQLLLKKKKPIRVYSTIWQRPISAALAHAAWDAEKQGAKVSVLDAETGAPLTIEDFEAKLNELIETFRKAAADADDDDDASDDADNDEETPQQAQSDDAAENLIEIASPASLALAANEINAIKAAEAARPSGRTFRSPCRALTVGRRPRMARRLFPRRRCQSTGSRQSWVPPTFSQGTDAGSVEAVRQSMDHCMGEVLALPPRRQESRTGH